MCVIGWKVKELFLRIYTEVGCTRCGRYYDPVSTKSSFLANGFLFDETLDGLDAFEVLVMLTDWLCVRVECYA